MGSPCVGVEPRELEGIVKPIRAMDRELSKVSIPYAGLPDGLKWVICDVRGTLMISSGQRGIGL